MKVDIRPIISHSKEIENSLISQFINEEELLSKPTQKGQKAINYPAIGSFLEVSIKDVYDYGVNFSTSLSGVSVFASLSQVEGVDLTEGTKSKAKIIDIDYEKKQVQVSLKSELLNESVEISTENSYQGVVQLVKPSYCVVSYNNNRNIGFLLLDINDKPLNKSLKEKDSVKVIVGSKQLGPFKRDFLVLAKNNNNNSTTTTPNKRKAESKANTPNKKSPKGKGNGTVENTPTKTTPVKTPAVESSENKTTPAKSTPVKKSETTENTPTKTTPKEKKATSAKSTPVNTPTKTSELKSPADKINTVSPKQQKQKKKQ